MVKFPITDWERLGGADTRRICLFFLLLLLAWRMATSVADNDLWAYLAFGREAVLGGYFPREDLFSYMPTLPRWIYHEWLTGVLLFPIYGALGGEGLQLAKFFLGFMTWFLLWKSCRRGGASEPWSAVALGVGSIPMTIAFSPVRAQIFGNFFFAATLLLLLDASVRRSFRRLALFPAVIAAWANCHGGFIAGLGIVALFALGEKLSRRPWTPYLLVLLVACLATLVNPYGVAYWRFIFSAVSMPRPNIPEWGSLLSWAASDRGDPVLLLFSIALFFVALGSWLAAGTRDASRLLLIVVTAALAAKHVRHLPFLVMTASVSAAIDLTVITGRMRDFLPARPAVLRFFRAGMITAAIVVIARLVAAHPLRLSIPSVPGEGGHFPVHALAFARERGIAGNLAVWFDWGSYVAYHDSGRFRISYDGRYETVYANESTRVNFDFWEGKSADLLTEFPTDFVLLPPDCPAVMTMGLIPGWKEIYRDSAAVFWRRTTL